jgi:translocation and assembly module TamA
MLCYAVPSGSKAARRAGIDMREAGPQRRLTFAAVNGASPGDAGLDPIRRTGSATPVLTPHANARCARPTAALAALLVAVLAVIALAGWAGPAVAEATVAYEVKFEGVADKDLRKGLEAISNLVALKDKPPPSLVALQRRAEGDLPRFRQVMRSRGYYVGTAGIEIDGGKKPVRVAVKVTPGPLFRLGKYTVVFTRAPPAGLKTDPKSLGLELGKPAAGAPILAAERKLRTMLAARGYPLAKIIKRRAIADRQTERLTVTLTVDPGTLARFGPVTVTGLKTVDERFVRNRFAWKRGERYDPRRVVETRKALVDSRLFSSIKITQAGALDANGELPITVALGEAKQRTLGAGASYSTSQGPGAQVFWEHRNIFGAGEKLRLEAKGSFVTRSLAALITKPDFLRQNQTLGGKAEFKQELTDAYHSRVFGGSASIRRQLDRLHAVIAGLSFENSSITENGKTETFQLFGLPLSFERDSTDDLLDPKTGERVTVSVTPYLDAGGTVPFSVTRFGGSIYRPLTEDRRIIAAFRAAYGTILGDSLTAIPATKRLYSGGGGSNRGYGFQKAGPIDTDGDPLGGRSLIEFSAELRVRVTEKIGIVPFVDAGRAYRGMVPDFSKGMLWSAGLGVRYHTGFGPIRLDVAVPIDRRSGIDNRFQFYISIGQAF